MNSSSRESTLVDLIQLRLPVDVAISRVSALDWDSDVEFARLTRVDVRSALHLFEEQAISGVDLVRWAEAVHMRDDIGVEDQTVRDALSKLSSPELFGGLRPVVDDVRSRLDDPMT